jgi:glycosyltransferase involved in cell wall biosynthesis
MNKDRPAEEAARPSFGTAGASALPRLLVVGGEDHHLRVAFLLELRKRGFEVAAAGTGESDDFRRNGIPFFRYYFDRFVNPPADWRALRSLAAIISSFRPDIVQSFDTKPGILVPLAARSYGRSKVVRTINGLGWVFASRSPFALVLRPVVTGLHRVTASLTSLTVFQNRSDQTFFERGRIIGDGGSQLIPGSGVDVEGFERALASNSPAVEMRESLGLRESEVIITVSRLSQAKGIPTLLRAATLLKKTRPGVCFLLVGPRETERPFAVAQADLDRCAPYVKVLGPRKDVPALLRLSNVFAFPTELYEGVPRVLLEAALAGVPIVTTGMPGCVDVVQDGWSGFVVPPGDARRLADRIGDLLGDPLNGRTMAERARALVEREFSLGTTVDRYVEAYARL